MDKSNWENFITELILINKKKAFEAKERDQRKKNDSNSGMFLAYYEIMSTFLSKCVTFQINPKELNLENFIADDLFNERRTKTNESELELFKEIETMEKDENTFKYFTMDMVEVLIEIALKAKNQDKNAKTKEDRDFYGTRLMVYKHFFENFYSLLKKFQLDPKEIKLENFNPEDLDE